MTTHRKHTPDSLRHELNMTGNPAEIADISLLISNAERPKGSPQLPGVAPASNRQAQRRYHRERTRDQNSVRNTARRVPAVGDYVRVPDGQVWLVTQIAGDVVRSDDQPGCLGYRGCPVGLVTIVDAPTAPTPSAPLPPASNGRAEAAEALYQGVWDAYEVQDWAALERALRAYELSTS